jgi:hypothetical protein
MESDDVRLARLQEQYRCEKILLNFIRRHKDNFSKVELLKSVLKKIRKKEKAND